MDERSPREGEIVDIWLQQLNRREPDVEFIDGEFLQEGKTFKQIGTKYIFVSHWMSIPEPPRPNKS